MMFPLRFYILGCQRTGTTLLRLILESHSSIHCFDETLGYEILRARDFSSLPGKNVSRIGFKIPRWTEQLLEHRVIDEVEHTGCGAFYLGEPLLFVHRDAKAVVSSMIRLIEDGSPWIERWGRPLLLNKIEKSNKFCSRYFEQIKLLKEYNYSQAAVGALYWVYKTESYFDYCQAGLPILAVRYEDLVTSPETVLRLIVSHLGLEWEESLLTHEKLSHGETNDSGLTLGGTDSKRPIETSSLGQWTKNLSSEDVRQIESIAGELNTRVSNLQPDTHPPTTEESPELRLRATCVYLALSVAQAELTKISEDYHKQGMEQQQLNQKAHEVSEWGKGLLHEVKVRDEEITRLNKALDEARLLKH